MSHHVVLSLFDDDDIDLEHIRGYRIDYKAADGTVTELGNKQALERAKAVCDAHADSNPE